MQGIQHFNWENIKVIVFDVDGTLYTQSKMRKKMLFALLSYYLLRPWKLIELKMLRDFRNEREKRLGFVCTDLENAQFEWCAQKGNYPVSKVKEVVEYWMFNYPNKYLSDCVYPGTRSFFKALKQRGYRIAIYSDYKATEKLKAMDLEADLVLSSTDSHIDTLKPDPKAIHYISQYFKVLPEECLFIGDRQELDGQCAINAGAPYLIVDKKPFNSFDFYSSLELKLLKSMPMTQNQIYQEV